MKLASLTAILLTVGIALADPIPDLTKADEATFKTNIGKTVSIQGKLENGKIGCSVWDGTRKVSFYVVPDLGPGGFAYPKAWMDLIGHQVRGTGELKFKGFDHSHDRPDRQSALDHYFMVLQMTKLEKVAIPEPKAGQAGADQPATKPAEKPPREESTPNPHVEGWPPVAGGRPLALGVSSRLL